jgi:hypothetical protein
MHFLIKKGGEIDQPRVCIGKMTFIGHDALSINDLT